MSEAARAASGRFDLRFDLRFKRGKARLVLRSPVRAGWLTLDALEVELDVAGPMDLRDGAARFRHARGRVVDLDLGVQLTRGRVLEAEGGVAPVTVDGTSRRGISLTLRDEIGALAATLKPRLDGHDVLLEIDELRWLTSGPRNVWRRSLLAAEGFGLRLDPSHAALRWERPVRRCLAAVMLPRGWRVPDERGVGLSLDVEGDGVRIRSAPEVAVAEVDAAGAKARLVALESGAATAPSWIRAMHMHAPSGPAAEVVAAVEADRVPTGALTRMVAREPSAALCAEAWLTAAEWALEREDAGRCTQWVLEALAHAPRETAHWVRWCERLAEHAWVEALEVAEVVVAGPLPRTTRARLAAEVVLAVLEGETELDEEEELRVGRLLESARSLAPAAPEVLAALAAEARWRGELGDAAALWLRAAEVSEARETAGRYRAMAAEVVLGREGPRAAEPLFEAALAELGGEDPALLARLGVIAAERGDHTRRDSFFGRLLRESPRDEGHADALLTAARWYIEEGEPARAKPFMKALGPSFDDVADRPPPPEVVRDRPQAPREPRSVVTRGRSSSMPPVTLVHVADDEMRALLEDAGATEDPAALLEGALEEALEEADPAGIERVLRVLDRLPPFDDEPAIRERAKRLLARLRGES